MASIYEKGIASTSSSGDSIIISDIITTGAVIWVDSVNGSAGGAGTQGDPVDDILQAQTNATANNGDIVIIASGHTETSATALTLSKAGIRYFGLGTGTNRPNFTVSGVVDLFDITGADIEINNLYFPIATAAATSRINVGVDHCKIKNCAFLCGASDASTITLATGASNCTIDSCTFTVNADGPNDAIIIENINVTGLHIKSCSFDGGTSSSLPINWDNAAIYSTVAHTEFLYEAVTLTNGSDILHTAASKGIITGTIAGDDSHVQISS